MVIKKQTTTSSKTTTIKKPTTTTSTKKTGTTSSSGSTTKKPTSGSTSGSSSAVKKPTGSTSGSSSSAKKSSSGSSSSSKSGSKSSAKPGTPSSNKAQSQPSSKQDIGKQQQFDGKWSSDKNIKPFVKSELLPDYDTYPQIKLLSSDMMSLASNCPLAQDVLLALKHESCSELEFMSAEKWLKGFALYGRDPEWDVKALEILKLRDREHASLPIKTSSINVISSSQYDDYRGGRGSNRRGGGGGRGGRKSSHKGRNMHGPIPYRRDAGGGGALPVQPDELIDVITGTTLTRSDCADPAIRNLVTALGYETSQLACEDYFDFVEEVDHEPTYQELFGMLIYTEFGTIRDENLRFAAIEAMARQYYAIAGPEGRFDSPEELFTFLGGIHGWHGYETRIVVKGNRLPMAWIYAVISGGDFEEAYGVHYTYEDGSGVPQDISQAYEDAARIWDSLAWDGRDWTRGYECGSPAVWGNVDEEGNISEEGEFVVWPYTIGCP